MNKYLTRLNKFEKEVRKDPELKEFWQDVDNNLWEKENPTVMFKEALRDMEAVIDLGGKKYGYGSWKDTDNPSLQHKANIASIFRHVAEASVGIKVDPESGQDPRLHAAFRLMASYVRDVRGYSPKETPNETTTSNSYYTKLIRFLRIKRG